MGTTKSELWAISQKLTNYPSKSELKWDSSTSLTSPSLMENSTVPSSNLGITAAAAQTVPQQAQSALSFPLGWYDSISNPDTLNQIAKEGMNIVVPYTNSSSVQEIKSYLDRAAAVGIKVLVEIPRLQVRRDHRWLITQMIKELKTHPAVYGWYLFDEPEFIQLSPALLERVYKAIKAEDPQHKVAVAFGKPLHIREYLKAADTIMYFNYPIMDGSSEFDGLGVPSFINKLQSVAHSITKDHDLWFILQGYGRDKHGRVTKFKRRLPTFAESRYMIYSALIAQTDGLLFWTHYRSQQQWIDSILTPILQEVQPYLSTVNSKTLSSSLTGGLKVNNSQVQAKLYQNSTTQELLLIAVNNSRRPSNTTISIGQSIAANSAQVLPNKSAIKLEKGTLKDFFEPYS
ncbi:MAG: hypothetical protein AAF383_08975, partial [Cyanobacteria bacterium P01_A01_bin.83]